MFLLEYCVFKACVLTLQQTGKCAHETCEESELLKSICLGIFAREAYLKISVER